MISQTEDAKMKTLESAYERLEKMGPHSAFEIRLEQRLDEEVFLKYLEKRVKVERERHSKTVWVYLNEDNMDLLSPLLKAGFKIHHGLDNRVAVYQWLETLSDLVPPYSSIYAGCGGAIIEDDCLLLVQEKNGARADEWGIPGGLMNKGEAINQAAVREVQEETGLKTQYQYIIYFRELNNYLHGGCDMYFVCYLKLANGVTKDNISLCSREIKAHEWVPLSSLSSFLSTHKIYGTQKLMLPYFIELYERGFDFNKGAPNSTVEFTVASRGAMKRFTEHKLLL